MTWFLHFPTFIVLIVSVANGASAAWASVPHIITNTFNVGCRTAHYIFFKNSDLKQQLAR